MMNKEYNEKLENDPEDLNQSRGWRVGDKCVMHNPKSKNFNRCRITKIFENGKFEVSFFFIAFRLLNDFINIIVINKKR